MEKILLCLFILSFDLSLTSKRGLPDSVFAVKATYYYGKTSRYVRFSEEEKEQEKHAPCCVVRVPAFWSKRES